MIIYLRLFILWFLSCLSFCCLEPLSQCMGVSWTGQVNCCKPMQCLRWRDDYWQCVYKPQDSSNCSQEGDFCNEDSNCCENLKCKYSEDDKANVCTLMWVQDGISILNDDEDSSTTKTLDGSVHTAKLGVYFESCAPSFLQAQSEAPDWSNFLLPFFDSSDNTTYAFAAVNAALKNNIKTCGCYQIDMNVSDTSDEYNKASRLIFQIINTISFLNSSGKKTIPYEQLFYLNIPGSKFSHQTPCPSTLRTSTPPNSYMKKTGTSCCPVTTVEQYKGCIEFFRNILKLIDQQVEYKRILCPQALLNQSNCSLSDELA